MNAKIPKIVYGIPIVILSAVIINHILDESDIGISSTALVNPNPDVYLDESESFSNNLYSGPFAILDGTYGINDTVFLIGDEIPLDSKGKIDFIRPDGRLHHTLQYDGSKNAVNHYFTPVSSSDLQECPDCKFFGTWKISFRSNQGMTYLPITFEVLNSED